MKNNIAIWVALLVLTATACQKDEEAPTISIASPTNLQEFGWGDELHIEATFADDQEVASYRIKMGNEAGDLATDFDIDFQGNLNDPVFDFHEHVIVPDGIGSIYWLHFEVTDAAGNSTTQKLELHFIP